MGRTGAHKVVEEPTGSWVVLERTGSCMGRAESHWVMGCAGATKEPSLDEEASALLSKDCMLSEECTISKDRATSIC